MNCLFIAWSLGLGTFIHTMMSYFFTIQWFSFTIYRILSWEAKFTILSKKSRQFKSLSEFHIVIALCEFVWVRSVNRCIHWTVFNIYQIFFTTHSQNEISHSQWQTLFRKCVCSDIICIFHISFAVMFAFVVGGKKFETCIYEKLQVLLRTNRKEERKLDEQLDKQSGEHRNTHSAF